MLADEPGCTSKPAMASSTSWLTGSVMASVTTSASSAVGRSSVTYGFQFSHAGLSVAHGRIVAVRCLMHPGRKPEPVPVPAEIGTRLAAYRADA